MFAFVFALCVALGAPPSQVEALAPRNAPALVAPVVTGPGKLTTRTFKSRAVPGKRRYLVWQPPLAQDARLPVVVFLHGLGGEGKDWFDPELGDLGPRLDRLMGPARGDAPGIAPFIAIAPDGDNGYWTDHLNQPAEGYGTLVDEVLADAARHLPIDLERAALVGVSMGGHGAMSVGLMHPQRYRAIVSMAGALFAEAPTHRPIYKRVWGFPADPAHWAKTSPIAILTRADPATLPPLWLGVGKADLDRFLDLNVAADALLTRRGIPHEFMLVEGGHTWTTWGKMFEAWLGWLDAKLR